LLFKRMLGLVMRLSDNTVLFTLGGIPILGSYDSGHVIGLTPEGRELCGRMQVGNVTREEVDAVDARLASALIKWAFLQDGIKSNGVPSKVAYVHVTQRCNLSCVGCYSLDEKRNKLHDAPVEQFKTAFEKLVELGVVGIIVSGGEPFLRVDLPELCETAKECGICQITIITNGTLVAPETISRLAPFVDCVSVSFDGLSQSAPSYIRKEQRFDELVGAIKLIQDAGIQAHMIPTIHRANYREMADYVRLSNSLGTSMNFSLLSCCDPDCGELKDLVPAGEALEEMGRAVFEVGKTSSIDVLDLPVGPNLSVRRNCGAARTTLSIDADGTVYPCHMLHHSELSMGNIFRDDATSISESPIAHELRNLHVDGLEGCQACSYKQVCGGGCRARAYSETGSLLGGDPYCALTREF